METKEFVKQAKEADNFVKQMRKMNEDAANGPPLSIADNTVTNPTNEVLENGSKLNVDSGNTKHKVTWVGTSLSKALDRKKLENDLHIDLKVEKAYCIGEEGRFKETNFTAKVPEIVHKGGVDTLVLQTGSIELTNINVNKAMMDVSKDINEYKKEWYQKAEEDSTNLFAIAEDAIARDKKLNVVIVKRLQRFDRSSKDILGIKTNLSKFANHVYDQLWLKRGSPSRIHIIELELGCDNSQYLKEIIYGKPNHPQYDGIHLTGPAALRHFTYRAVQKLSSIITKPSQPSHSVSPAHNYRPAAAIRPVISGRHARNLIDKPSDLHTNCPQAQFQDQLRSDNKKVNTEEQFTFPRRSRKTYRRKNVDVASKYGSNYYSIPVQNRYPENY